MRDRFEQEDSIVWFDDALFFLRGGYEFFCYLNLSSGLTMRGRIFGGLNHAASPPQRLTSWFSRFVDEARARNAPTVDVFLAEEINSGSSAHRTMNVIRDAMSQANPAGAPLEVDFWYYLACTDESIFNVQRFQNEIVDKRRIQNGNLVIRNNFRLFQGPLLAYDEERYSGLRVITKGHDLVESYQAIRHRATTFHLICPTTGEEPFWCAPGENDLDNFVGVLVLNLLGVGGAVPYNIMEKRVAPRHALNVEISSINCAQRDRFGLIDCYSQSQPTITRKIKCVSIN
jgi:hypothetical protein